MSFVTEILELVQRYGKTRNVEAPTKEKGVVLYDGDANERLVLMANKQLHGVFELATVADFTAFVRDIPVRFPKDVPVYRELNVMVDGNDIPHRVNICLPVDDPRTGQAGFSLRQHEDFKRWFGGAYMSQTDFRRMLLELEDQHDQGDLIKILNFLEYKTEVTYEATVDTERNFVIGYKEKDGKGGLQIPKTINVKCPVISGAAYIVETTFDIVLRKPTAERPNIMFALVPAGKDPKKILRDASLIIVEHEILMPTIETLKANGVETVSPVYVREAIETTTFDPAQQTFSL